MALPLDELIEFLAPTTRMDVRCQALEYVKGLTAQEDKALFRTSPKLVKGICSMAIDPAALPVVRADAFVALTNLAAERDLGERMARYDLLGPTVTFICLPDNEHADSAAMLLGNLTRSQTVVELLLDLKQADGRSIVYQLIDVFCTVRPADKPKPTLHFLANVIFNLTQRTEGRRLLMLRAGEGCVLQRLVPFVSHPVDTRRGGIVGALRNCCFEVKEHVWLLGPEVNLATHLLLPLSGPEELHEDDMDGMPDDLQYLPSDKKREPDADIRKMLVEALTQLCSSKFGREFLRKTKAYPIIRDYHLWEPEKDVQDVCTNLGEILVMDDDATVDNYKDVHIPFAAEQALLAQQAAAAASDK